MDTALGSRSIGIDLCYHNTLAALAWHCIGRSNGETERCRISRIAVGPFVLGDVPVHHFFDLHRDGLLRSVTEDPELDLAPRIDRGDFPCKVAGILDGLIVDRFD